MTYCEPVEVLNMTVDLTPARDLVPLPEAPTLAMIQQLQDVIAQLPQTVNEPEHYFADGLYGRELFVEAGACVIGKIHRHEHLFQLLSGEATICSDGKRERVKGPRTWVSQPGIKRAVVAHTDCLFFNVHVNPDNTRDLDVLEAQVIEPEPARHLAGSKSLQENL